MPTRVGLVSFNQSTYVATEREGFITSVLVLSNILAADTDVQVATRAITATGKLN